MKTTSMRLLGATLGATALVGASTAAANACDFGSHDGGDNATSSAQAFSQSSDRSWGDERGDGHVGHRHHGHHWGHHRSHHTVSFEDKQAAIVDRLTQADQRLSSWIEKVQAEAADNPDGDAAQQLTELQQRQADLESLIAAVKAASNEDELKAAFDDARSSDSTDQSDSDGTVTAPAAPVA